MPAAERASLLWRPRWEHLAWGLIVVIAMLVRLAPNDALALNTAEAQRTLAAWQLQQGLAPSWWDAPALVAALSLVFLVGSAGPLTAHLIPAFAGTAGVAAAFLHRRHLGRWAALIAAALLALSPLGLASGRTVSELPLAVAIGLVVGGLLLSHRPESGGSWKPWFVGAGCAVLLNLGAPGVSTLLALVVSGAVALVFGSAAARGSDLSWLGRWRPLLGSLVVGHVLLSTGCLTHPEGLGWSSGVAWARHFEGDGAVLLRWVLLAHAEGAVVLVGGVTGITLLTRAIRSGMAWGAGEFLAVWSLSGLLLYAMAGEPAAPSAGVASTPLALLAARTLAGSLGEVPGWVRNQTLGLLPAMAVLGVFIGLTGLELASAGNTGGNRIAALMLAALLLLLCALALAVQSARPWAALALALVVLGLPLLVHSAARAGRGELFLSDERIHATAIATLRERVSLVPHRPQDGIRTVQVATRLRPLLAWHLRDLASVRFSDDPALDADVVIAPAGDAQLFATGVRRIVNLDLREPPASGSQWTVGALWSWAMTGRLPAAGRPAERISLVVRA